MNDLIKSINENYNMNVNNIKKLGITTINDIYLVESDNKKYVIKIYNVDEGIQINNSLSVQKKVFESLGIAADVLINTENKLYTKYKCKFYAIQEYIEEQENIKFDRIKETANSLFLLHKKLREFDESTYKNKKEYRDYIEIKKSIKKSRNILKETKIEEETRNIFERLLNKRTNLLEKYKCIYNPRECQIIHRDIRPSNIIVKNDKVYFIDFDYVAYGDLLFEIGSSAMLISNFEIEKAKEFIKTYNICNEKEYTNEYIFKNLLDYYVQSDFPIKLINKVKNEALVDFIENRLKCLEFCEKIIME